jgi:hypothetical protein
MTLRKQTLMLAALSLALTLGGCASGGTRTRASSSSTILTQEQLASANSDNLYDVISKLRPEWLTSRGTTSATDMTPTSVDVYMNGTMLGKAEYLREMRLSDVTQVRYWDAGQASARFGMGHPRGVIEVSRK